MEDPPAGRGGDRESQDKGTGTSFQESSLQVTHGTLVHLPLTKT